MNDRSEYDPEYLEWRKAVFMRDKTRCQMPGCNRRKYRMQAHHIYRWADAPFLRYEVTNGVTLCPSCHFTIRNNEDAFVDMFLEIVKENS